MAALLLSLSNIALSFGGAPLFAGASLEIAPRARIALVGRNGAGKSTLLKIAAGIVEPDSGERFVHPGAQMRYVRQEPDFGEAKTAIEFAAAALDPQDGVHRAERTLEELGVAPGIPLAACSGGEARRVGLAAAIAADPDILLLDEPTNHLDLPTIEQLEAMIAASRAAIAVISHDRRFLERTTNRTVWIDRGETRALDKGFAAFEDWRDQTLEEEAAARHKLDRKIAAEEDWVRYGVTARRKRNVRRLKELGEMKARRRDHRGPQGQATFAETTADASGKRVIVARGIEKSYGGRLLVKDFSIEIVRGEKIGLAAPNGAGKTTLLNMLLGRLEADAGTIEHGTNIELAALDQRRKSLKPEMRLADAITEERGDWVTAGGAKKHVATYLQDFLFAPEQWRAPVSSLSGGERGRLVLAAALAKPSNLMALDEPTNDLDLETLDLLEELLANYSGTLILVSHDRSFLDRVATAIIAPDPDEPGQWRRYAGGYSDMLAQRGAAPGGTPAATAGASRPSPGAQKTPDKPAATAKKLSYKDQYALDRLPERIAALESEIAALKEALEDQTLFARDPQAFQAKADALEAAEASLAAAETEWLELEMKREALEG